MSVPSINEPNASRTWMVFPPSINEPPKPALSGPVVTSLSPNTAVAGSATDITMHVRGDGFVAGSVITFNGLDEPTTFIGRTDISTGVKPSLFVVPATCPVGVRNPGGMTSNKLNFTFTATELRTTDDDGDSDDNYETEEEADDGEFEETHPAHHRAAHPHKPKKRRR